MSDKDIEELNQGIAALVSELSSRACKAESALYAIQFEAEECSRNGGNQFFCDDVTEILKAKGFAE